MPPTSKADVPIVLHITTDLPGRFKAIGLLVAEHVNVVTVWCPGCTERQDYHRLPDGEWSGSAFLHIEGCPHFRQTLAKLHAATSEHGRLR